MAQVGWTEYTYVFFVDGEIVEQNNFLSDEDALAHAQKEAEKHGKKVLVARWLESTGTPNKA